MRVHLAAFLIAASCLGASFGSTAALADEAQVASLPAAAQGEDGCYFGECPEPGATPPSLPPEEQTGNWPDPNQSPPNQSPWPQNEYTSICQTPQFWCVMWETGPVGTDCWCSDWYGNIYTGWTVPE